MSTRYPPGDLYIGCRRCWDDDPDVACECPCHEEDEDSDQEET